MARPIEGEEKQGYTYHSEGVEFTDTGEDGLPGWYKIVNGIFQDYGGSGENPVPGQSYLVGESSPTPTPTPTPVPTPTPTPTGNAAAATPTLAELKEAFAKFGWDVEENDPFGWLPFGMGSEEPNYKVKGVDAEGEPKTYTFANLEEVSAYLDQVTPRPPEIMTDPETGQSWYEDYDGNPHPITLPKGKEEAKKPTIQDALDAAYTKYSQSGLPEDLATYQRLLAASKLQEPAEEPQTGLEKPEFTADENGNVWVRTTPGGEWKPYTPPKKPTPTELMNDAIVKYIESGMTDEEALNAALTIDDIMKRPSQQQRLEAAIEYAKSPADYLIIAGMMRGEIPITQQGADSYRLGPRSQVFDAFGVPKDGAVQDPSMLGGDQQDGQAPVVPGGGQPGGTGPMGVEPPPGGQTGGWPPGLADYMDQGGTYTEWIAQGNPPVPGTQQGGQQGSVTPPPGDWPQQETPEQLEERRRQRIIDEEEGQLGGRGQGGAKPPPGPLGIDQPSYADFQTWQRQTGRSGAPTPQDMEAWYASQGTGQQAGGWPQQKTPAQLEEERRQRRIAEEEGQLGGGWQGGSTSAAPPGAAIPNPGQEAAAEDYWRKIKAQEERRSRGATGGTPPGWQARKKLPSFLEDAYGQEVLSGSVLKPRLSYPALGEQQGVTLPPFRSGQAQQRQTAMEKRLFQAGLQAQGVDVETYLQQERRSTQPGTAGGGSGRKSRRVSILGY